MYLIGKNAKLTEIQSPGVTADPDKGISGTGPVTRWTGSADAYVDEDILDTISSAAAGSMRIQLSQTIVDLPVNIPVWPNEEDILTVKRLDVVTPHAQGWPGAAPQTETLIVRKIDGGLVMLGKLRVYVVRD